MYFGGVSDAQMRVRCSIGMHERKKQNENKNMKSYFPMTIATIHIAIIKLSRNISQMAL